MELGASALLCVNQPGGLENAQMLRDGLAGQAQAPLRGESSADLEQRLTVTVGEFVEDRTPRRIVESMEYVCHT